jgi:hypothetical protein
VGESHHEIMNAESGSIGSFNWRIEAAKSNCGGLFAVPGRTPPVEEIRTTRVVRSGQNSANVCAMMLPSEWPTMATRSI